MSSNESPVIALHASPGMEGQIVDWFGPLYEYLEDQGALPIVTIGRESFDLQTGSFDHYFFIEDETGIDGPSIALVETDITANSAYNTTGGLDGDKVPLLNHPRLRRLGSNRLEVFQLMPDAQAETRPLTHDRRSELDSVISEMSVPRVVVRPLVESLSRNVDNTYRGNAEEIGQSILEATRRGELPEDEDLVVQADEEPGSLSSLLRGADEEQSEVLATENPKSLRLHLIDNKLLIGVAALTLDGGARKLVFIDQDSIPDEAINRATAMNDLLRDKAQVVDSYIAIDEYWEPSSGAWKIRDVMTRRPAFIRDSESPDWAAKQRQGVGDKLVEMALRKY